MQGGGGGRGNCWQVQISSKVVVAEGAGLVAQLQVSLLGGGGMHGSRWQVCRAGVCGGLHICAKLSPWLAAALAAALSGRHPAATGRSQAALAAAAGACPLMHWSVPLAQRPSLLAAPAAHLQTLPS